MISVNKVKQILSAHLERGAIQSNDLSRVLGCYLAQDILSPMDVPSFDNSAMDGYAMNFDGRRREWVIEGQVQAGQTAVSEVGSGRATRIFTGAMIPEGADTVIPQELVNIEGEQVVYQSDKIKPGANVRLKGSQCRKGAQIMTKGTRVSPGSIGLLASVGVSQVKVYADPTVAIIVTGNELKEVGEELQDGEIYNSNGPMLEACLDHSEVEKRKIYASGDNKQELAQTINEALEEHDILVLSGGISVGDYDFVKECLEAAGVRELFYKVKQRPGKPLFAGKRNKQWVFALPGNPASVLSCYYQYVKPCIDFWRGKNAVFSPDAVLPLLKPVQKKKGFTFFMKARKTSEGVQVLSGQQSFNLRAFAEANCLILLEENEEQIEAGALVEVYNI